MWLHCWAALPSLIHRPHRGSPFRLWCVCVCAWCTLSTRALGKLGVAGICPQPLPSSSSSLLSLSLRLIVRPLGSDWCRSSHSKRGEWQTLLLHLFCHSLSNLPASVGRKKHTHTPWRTVRQRGWMLGCTCSTEQHRMKLLLELWDVSQSCFQGFKCRNELLFLHCLLIC